MMATRLLALLMIVAAVIFFAGWVVMYPSPDDPKNIKYVLWKAHLYRVDLDQATATMIGDPGRDKLVVGETKTELTEKFGFLLLPADASPYLRRCYEMSPWSAKDVLFIRRSPWMIVFDGTKATRLVLVKGC